MRREQVWLFPNTRVETVLKTRPMVSELCEHLGLDPWKMLRAGMVELGEEGGIPWPDLEQAVLGLPVPPADTDWAAEPLGRLMDHLARQHREFLREYLPAIGHALADFAGCDPDSLLHLRRLTLEWPDFAAALSAHIREEEDELFLRLLRYEACERRGSVAPEFAGGPAPSFAVVRLQEREHRDLTRLRRFLDQALPDPEGPGEDLLEKRLRPLFSDFAAALGLHAHLETGILLPRGAALERSLSERQIQGGPAGRERAASAAG
jgi:iron-sulfur cluster repair protein YtfE (RIC family)